MPNAAPAASPEVSIWRRLWRRRQLAIALLAIVGIAIHLLLRFGTGASPGSYNIPLWITLAIGGIPLILELLDKVIHLEFGADLLAGISIVASALLDEYLAGSIVVLMLSGGEALESFAVGRASAVLQALAKRLPSVAHRRSGSALEDVEVDSINVGDVIVILPHEVSPVDGIVIEGHSVMDESYLTGEPYMMSKTPGVSVMSGAINGDGALTIRAERQAIDSRYAKIMEVMRKSEEQRPRMRRLADQLGAFYTPLALIIAGIAWYLSGDATRFLAVIVVATPCPLLIAIPVAIIGSISLAAQMGVIVRQPAALEQIDRCRTVIFDKTGTLTYGEPRLYEQWNAPGSDPIETLALVASLERYSKHPLAAAIQKAADATVAAYEVSEASELPGQGMSGLVHGRQVRITSRKQLVQQQPNADLPPQQGGLECVILVDEQPAAVYFFRDAPRREGKRFIDHLGPRHQISKLMLVTGDRESEARFLAEQVGIAEVHFNQTPEQKLDLVRAETAANATIFVGDGINDAPSLTAATVGVAFGQNSDVTTEAAAVVVLDSSLETVDKLLHIGRRMRAIALESAVGGIALSMIGMLIAAAGWLPPVAGAISQEVIDVIVVLNALRAAFPPRELTDYDK
ncbi:heavy metal translocating P-type ATPase [Blastopirellula marina]|uniref:P-type Zn(2+) transporter n=1 Tax=Blastopirellula marina TaxID=124 RepID=A0A2S8F2Q4_9BACT|nr:heavy metal translocating P-type ATPase [Blastopirellula marina]PQO26429.1 cadmium-translocating P-type ATPase [Blastopirellula marina]PQO46936.1 cadmium-translocating P-type ATPase [Blastopirellula marina]PTL40742.1 cadmium-translocating P-type ATPase [Blastopirellula marina]